MSNIRWSLPAVSDYRDLIARIRDDNPAAARRVADRIKLRISRLRSMPRMGRPGRVADTRELVITDTPYVVIYEVVGSRDDIVVLRILHGARAWPPW